MSHLRHKLVSLNLRNNIVDESSSAPVAQFNESVLLESKSALATTGYHMNHLVRFGARSGSQVDFSQPLYHGPKFTRNHKAIKDLWDLDFKRYEIVRAESIILFEGNFRNESNVHLYETRMNQIIRRFVQSFQFEEQVDILFFYSEKYDFYGFPYADVLDLLRGGVEILNAEYGVDAKLLAYNIDEFEEAYDFHIKY